MVEKRIAMWSGPRNISTALMRAWESRGDTAVWDEPLYAHYLQATGRDHPGRDEIIRQHDSDWRSVVSAATRGPIPDGRTIFYQKHMAHHLLPTIDRAWVAELDNAFLIRSPREMLASLARILPNPTIEETGLPQQVELFDRLTSGGGPPPPVIDAAEVLQAPAAMLRSLCERLGVAYTDRMLSWPAGRRKTDGCWAVHWYSDVEKSTGFDRYAPSDIEPPPHLRSVWREADRWYARLHEHRLVPQ